MATGKSGSIVCLFLVIFLSLGSESQAANQLHFMHKPKYVQIAQEAGTVKSSEVPDIVALALGFSTNKELRWPGLSSGDFFRRPKANILFTVESVDDVKLQLDDVKATFPIEKDAPFISTEAVSEHIESLFSQQNPLTVDLSAAGKLFTLHSKHPHLFRDIPATPKQLQPALLNSESSVLYSFDVGSLNFSKDADFAFLSELQIIQEIMLVTSRNKYLTEDNVPDIFTFTFGGIHQLQLKYGGDSEKVNDGVRVLSAFINKLMKTMLELYGDDVLAEVATLTPSDPVLRRYRRQADDAKVSQTSDSEGDPSDFNVADSTSENFPYLFHIVLWMSVFWILAVFAISYMMWYMDPGDTIIYRMTGQRIKID